MYKCETTIAFFINWIKLILNVYNNEIGSFIIQFKRDNGVLNSPLFYHEQVVCKQSLTTSTDCDVLFRIHFGVSIKQHTNIQVKKQIIQDPKELWNIYVIGNLKNLVSKKRSALVV